MDYLYDTMVLQQHQQKQQNLSLQVFWEAIKIIVKKDDPDWIFQRHHF